MILRSHRVLTLTTGGCHGNDVIIFVFVASLLTWMFYCEYIACRRSCGSTFFSNEDALIRRPS